VNLRTDGQAGPLVLYDVVTAGVKPRSEGARVADGARSSLPDARSGGTRVARYSSLGPVVATSNCRDVSRSPRSRRTATRAAPLQRVGWIDPLSVLDDLRLTRVLSLRGKYEVETLSPDGERVFPRPLGRQRPL